MFYDGAHSRRIVHYNRANVHGFARSRRWEEICREKIGSVEKRDQSLTLYFYKPHHIESSYRIRSSMLPDCKSPWIAMERDDPVQYNETLNYNSHDWYRRVRRRP